MNKKEYYQELNDKMQDPVRLRAALFLACFLVTGKISDESHSHIDKAVAKMAELYDQSPDHEEIHRIAGRAVDVL